MLRSTKPIMIRPALAIRRLGLLFAAGLLAMTVPAAARAAPGVFTFQFSAYANRITPGGPGYVGPFQLGKAMISGQGTIRESDGALVSGGVITHSDNLLDRRYPNPVTTWQVLRGAIVQNAGGVIVLKLQVTVTASNYPYVCPVGTMGVITLIKDDRRLSNGWTQQGVGMEAPNPGSRAPDGGAACRTHVHGFNNADNAYTVPTRGGPGGGIWATVDIRRQGGASILGYWKRRSDQSIVAFTAEGNGYVGRIVALGPTLGRYRFKVGEETFRVSSAGPDAYAGQVEWRWTDGRVAWRPTRQQVTGNLMRGDVGDWDRVVVRPSPAQPTPAHQSGGMMVDPPQ